MQERRRPSSLTLLVLQKRIELAIFKQLERKRFCFIDGRKAALSLGIIHKQTVALTDKLDGKVRALLVYLRDTVTTGFPSF